MNTYDKIVSIDKDKIKEAIEKHSTPFYIYDEKGILESYQNLTNAFSWNNNFVEYFAVKATPNPFILKSLIKRGAGLDCSSISELFIAEKLGLNGSRIMFTSNNTTLEEYNYASKLNAIINLDDISHLDYFGNQIKIPEKISFRFNPGSLKNGNSIIGNPLESKFGLTEYQILKAVKIAKEKKINSIGIHTMVASNELDPFYFIETAEIVFKLILKIEYKHKIKIDFVNLGGGLGIPYKPEQRSVDLNKISSGIQEKYTQYIINNNLFPFDISMECGRFITGPHGYLVAQVQNIKETYKKYAGLDVSTNNLLRAAIYGAYHHITVLNKEIDCEIEKYDIVGSLCENNDKLAFDRYLPKLCVNDIVVIHDVGAHGHSMGFNYNGKLRSKELLLDINNKIQLIRRAETLDDYFRTIDFNYLNGY